MHGSPGTFFQLRPWALALTLCLLASGCASVSVTDEQHAAAARPTHAPETIWVRDFGYKLSRNQTRTSGPELKAFLDAQVSALTVKTVAELRESGFQASGLARNQTLPRGGWLVAGNMTHLDVGDRWLRTGVGFGEGATRLDTEVLVFDLTQTNATGGLPAPFYAFRTTGGSGNAPGVAAGVIVSGVVSPMTLVGGGLKARADLSADTARTSRMISGALQDYLADNRLVAADRQKQHAKRLGDYTGSWFDDLGSYSLLNEPLPVEAMQVQPR